MVSISEPKLIPLFLEACPEFSERWREHVEYWGNEEAGSYNDLAELARFLLDSYESGNLETVTKALDLTERLLQEKDPQTVQLLTVGLIESLQITGSHRPFDNDDFVKLLGPASKQAWFEIEKVWDGKSTLMEVIRAEKKLNKT